jgi:uncharacterized membrane protein
MEQKKSKYDTNPLDTNVSRRTEEVWGTSETGATGSAGSSETEGMSGATRDINRTPQKEARADFGAEAPTRRYDNPRMPTSYPSVFVPPVYEPPLRGGAHASPSHLPPQAATSQPFNRPPSSRTIANLNMPENVVMMLPYLPFPVVGAVVAAVLLFLVPRNEPRARFHAAQGMALHLIVLGISILTSMVDGFLSGPPAMIFAIASAAFSLLAFVFFIISMIRVYKGEPHVIAPLNDLTAWLNQKIEPRK